MWAKDRDIALLDPAVFRDIAWAGQTLTRGTATIDGTTLTASTIETSFDKTSITDGHIVNAGGLIIEAIGIVSDSALTVSVLRPTADASPEQPRQLTDVPFTVISYRAQIEWAHRQVLAMLGLRADNQPGPEGQLSESAVTNPQDLSRLEALCALHLIYSGAGALEPSDSPNNHRSQTYRHRFNDERQRTLVHLDTNNDNTPDTTRRLNILQLTRA